MSYALLTIIASVQLGQIPTGPAAAFPQWNGPDPTVVHVLSILYASLSASLLAALVAMLGKQWLNRFSRADIRGSIAERSRDRVRKSKGMETWHFDLVMEFLPVMLQLALFLLGYALSNYLFFLNRTVAAVIIGFTAFGLLFYVLIVSAATLSYTCPFQTPPSLIIRFMIRFDDEHRKYLRRFREWFGRLFSWRWKPQRRGPGDLHPLGRFGTVDGRNIDGHIELALIRPSGQQLPLLDEGADVDGSVLDSECIVRIFEISTDTDVIQANMKFIPEIFWHAGIRKTPLERLYTTVLECFDRSTGRLVVIPKLRNQAYLGARALIHLVIQRRCFGDGSDQAVLESISARHQIMGSAHYEGDSDLESTLSVIDHVFDKFEPIRWKDFSPTHTHLAWMAHTLLFRAWDLLSKGNILPEDIREFVGHTLSVWPPPPTPVIADCLLIIEMTLGTEVEIGHLFAVDKTRLFWDVLRQPDDISDKVGKHLSGLCDRFAEVFLNPASTTAEIDFALEAMAIVTSIITEFTLAKGRYLFHLVMDAPVTEAFTQEKKWQAARCAMRGLCRWWDRFWKWVGDPQIVLTFLDHHFDLATRGGEIHDEPIRHVFCTLGFTDDPVTIAALKRFDPTEPTFVRGICYAFQEDRPFRLRNSALWFLALIGDAWFNTPHPILEPDQMKKLCADWASIVVGSEMTYKVKKSALVVLFYMINSPHWRPHIDTIGWRVLELFTSVPEDLESLKRCLDKPELTDAIAEVGGPGAVVAWLKILWLKYGDLIPEVRERLATATKRIAQNGGVGLDEHLSVVDSELKNARDALAQHDTDSVVPAALALRMKIDSLRQAGAALLALGGN